MSIIQFIWTLSGNLSADLTYNTTKAHEDATQSYQLFDRVSEGESEAQTRAVHTLPECNLQPWKSEIKMRQTQLSCIY